jgi:hypothetical protein
MILKSTAVKIQIQRTACNLHKNTQKCITKRSFARSVKYDHKQKQGKHSITNIESVIILKTVQNIQYMSLLHDSSRAGAPSTACALMSGKKV